MRVLSKGMCLIKIFVPLQTPSPLAPLPKKSILGEGNSADFDLCNNAGLPAGSNRRCLKKWQAWIPRIRAVR